MPRMIQHVVSTFVMLCTIGMCSHFSYAESTTFNSKERTSYPIEEVSLTCPPPINVDCDDNQIYPDWDAFEAAGGAINLPMGCNVLTFDNTNQVIVSQNGCDFVFMTVKAYAEPDIRCVKRR